MASIGNDPNGFRRILFVAGDGSRKTIRLGKATAKQAEAFKVKVEALVSGQLNPGAAPDDEVARWLAGLNGPMHARLAAVGLVKPRTSAQHRTLASFVDGYIDGRTDAKPRTIINLKQARKDLVAFFSESREL